MNDENKGFIIHIRNGFNVIRKENIEKGVHRSTGFGEGLTNQLYSEDIPWDDLW